MDNEIEERLPGRLEPCNDPEILRIKTQFLALAQGLMNDGETRYTVLHALEDTIIDLIKNEHMKGDEEFRLMKDFLRQVAEDFGDWRKYLDLIDTMADQIRRNQDAGGDGNPYQ